MKSLNHRIPLRQQSSERITNSLITLYGKRDFSQDEKSILEKILWSHGGFNLAKKIVMEDLQDILNPISPPPPRNDSKPEVSAGRWAEPETEVISCRPRQAASVAVSITNLTSEAWISAGESPYSLCYHIKDHNQSFLTWDGLRSKLPQDLCPSETARMLMHFVSPDSPGLYTLSLTIVQDNAENGWLEERGCLLPIDLDLIVEKPFVLDIEHIKHQLRPRKPRSKLNREFFTPLQAMCQSQEV